MTGAGLGDRPRAARGMVRARRCRPAPWRPVAGVIPRVAGGGIISHEAGLS
jgi:hypothetical protein